MVDDQLTRQRWVAVACVATLGIIGALAWHSAFGWSALFPDVVLAGVVPAVISVLWFRARPQNVAGSAFTSLVALCWFLAVIVLRDSVGGVVPNGAAASGIAHGIANGWDGILSVPLPVPAVGQYLLVPVTMTWVATSLSAEIALRSVRPLVASIPVLLNFGAALVFGIGGPGPRVLLGVLGAVPVLFLAAGSAQPVVENATRSRPARTRRILEASLGLVVVLGVASVLGPALPGVGSAAPYNPRTSRLPPESPTSAINPLDELSRWAQAKPENLLRVKTSTPEPLRLAVLTSYDPLSGWSQTSRFEIAGATLPDAPSGSTKTGVEDIQIQKLRGPWLPSDVQPVQLTGTRAYVDPDSGVLIRGTRTSPTAYRVTFRIPASYENVATPDCTLDTALPSPAAIVVPGQISQLAQQYTSSATSPCQRAQDLVAAFRQHFSFDAKAPSGSNIEVLNNFLNGSKQDAGGEGTEEQFAAAFALMADSLSMDARVVVGFYPGLRVGPDTYEIGPQDATVWDEIDFANVGWVPFFPKPLKGGTPPNQQSAQQTSQTKLAPTPSGPSTGPGAVREVAPPPVRHVSTLEIVLLVVVIAVVLVLVCLLALWLLMAVWRKRISARRRREVDPRRRVLAAWGEAMDVLDGAGVHHRLSDTASDIVIVGAARLGDPGAVVLAPLGDLSNAARYAVEEPETDEADQAWACTEELSRVASASLDRRGRVIRAIDPRALFRARATTRR